MPHLIRNTLPLVGCFLFFGLGWVQGQENEQPQSVFVPELQVLEAQVQKAIEGVSPDPPPEELIKDVHFFTSDEKRHFLFRPAIENLGGVLIGVGSEQNYMLAAWARTEILILMDFDQLIVDLHYAHRAAFLHAATPDEFIDLWSLPKSKEFQNIIRETYSVPRLRKAALNAFFKARWIVNHRLIEIRDRYQKEGAQNFLTDLSQYQYIVDLYQTNRVFPIRGDLRAKRCMRQLGAVLKELKRPVRVLYLSNCEQYFDYSPDYRSNILSLPVDDKSVILRTRPTGFDYTYVIQRVDNYEKWLQDRRINTIHQMLPRSMLRRNQPVIEVVQLPESPKKVSK